VSNYLTSVIIHFFFWTCLYGVHQQVKYKVQQVFNLSVPDGDCMNMLINGNDIL